DPGARRPDGRRGRRMRRERLRGGRLRVQQTWHCAELQAVARIVVRKARWPIRNFERGFVKFTERPDVRRVFARSVTTLRTMGGPGWPRGALPAGRGRHREPDRAGLAPDIAGRTHPGRQRGKGDTAGRAFSSSRTGRTAVVGALAPRSGNRIDVAKGDVPPVVERR